MIILLELGRLSNIFNNETCQVLFQIASDDSYYNNEAIISQFVALHHIQFSVLFIERCIFSSETDECTYKLQIFSLGLLHLFSNAMMPLKQITMLVRIFTK